MTTLSNEQLREKLDRIFPCDCSFTKGFAFKKGDPCDGTCVLAPYKKRVEDLLSSQRQAILKEVREEVIGEDCPPECNAYITDNAVRAEQRIKLDAIERKYE